MNFYAKNPDRRNCMTSNLVDNPLKMKAFLNF